MDDNQGNLEKEINDILPELTRGSMALRFQEALILEESVKNGGPGSSQDAIINLMDYCKIGIRQMALKVNIPRRRLKDMLEGRRELTVEAVSAMHKVFKEKNPELFEE